MNRYGEIYVDNISSLKLVKTKMVKSVLAGRGQLKTMPDYKCAHAGIVFKEVKTRVFLSIHTPKSQQRCANHQLKPASAIKYILKASSIHLFGAFLFLYLALHALPNAT